MPLLELILKDGTMDFIEGLSKVGGYDSIMVVVDRLRKLWLFHCSQPSLYNKHVADVFSERVVSKQGIPKSIIIDRDNIILSNF